MTANLVALMISKLGFTSLLFSVTTLFVRVQGQCNPTQGPCDPIPGFSSEYTVDFTTTKSLPPEWIQADYEPISFGPKGVEFTLTDPTIAPYIWTKAYMHYGHVEVVMQTAPGVGVISSAVLMSDDLDEIDWEFSGNDFGQSTPTLQTNWFGKGITGWWDRGTQPHVEKNLTTNFHTFTLDWLPDSLTWSVDGTAIRTLYAKDGDADTHQYPQTPARFHLGAWDAGGPNVAWWTVNWAGGSTDVKGFPYTAYVKSVKIKPYKGCPMYQYADTSGSSGSVKCIDAPPNKATSASSGIPAAASSAPTQAAVQSSSQQAIQSSVKSPVTQSNPSIAQSPASSTIVPVAQSAAQPTSQSTSQLAIQTSSAISNIGPVESVKVSSVSQSIPSSSSRAATSSTNPLSSTTAMSPTIPTTTTTPSTSTTTPKATSTPLPPPPASPPQQPQRITTQQSSSPSPSLSPSPSTSPIKITCPASHQATYATPRGPFQIDCSTDYANGDLPSTSSFSNGKSAPSFQSCVDRCAAFPDGRCTAVNFVGGDGEGACYLKDPAGAAASRPGVQGARLVKGAPGGLGNVAGGGGGGAVVGVQTPGSSSVSTSASSVSTQQTGPGVTSSPTLPISCVTQPASSSTPRVLPPSSPTATVSVPSTGFQTVVRSSSSNPPGVTSDAPQTAPSPTSSNNNPPKKPLVCNEDNCLRNLMDQRFTKTASQFCATFTTGAVQALATTLEAVSNCERDAGKISSACSCFMAPTAGR